MSTIIKKLDIFTLATVHSRNKKLTVAKGQDIYIH